MKSSLYQAGWVAGAWGLICSTACEGLVSWSRDWACAPCIASGFLTTGPSATSLRPSLNHFSTWRNDQWLPSRSQAIKTFLFSFQILLLTVLTNVLLQGDYPPCPFYSQDFFHDNSSAWAGLHLLSPSTETLTIFKVPLNSASSRCLPGAPWPVHTTLHPSSHGVLSMRCLVSE